MFGIQKKTELNRVLREENEKLRNENAFLRKQQVGQACIYRQWDNLLQYDGRAQKNNLEEREE